MTTTPVTVVRAIRSVAFSFVFLLTLPPFALATLLCFACPYSVRYAITTGWAQLNLYWLAISCGVRHRVYGQEHIPAGPAIIFCKHQSTWETLALQKIFPPQVWVLKQELLRVPFFGWALALIEPIAINRKAGRKAIDQLTQQGTARLQKGRWVVVFPEGTRVAPGQKGRYRIGGAVLAEQSGYPVVPVAHNAGEFWPRRRFIKSPGEIQVVVGPPIESKGRSAADILAEAESWIETQMAEIEGKGHRR